MRDLCADGELSLDSDLSSFTFVMGITATTVKTLDITDNAYTQQSCAINYYYEIYDPQTATWSTLDTTPNYVSDLGTSTYLDYFIEIDVDGTDANSASYRPSSSFDLRITASMPDSIQSADKTTV